MKLEDIDKELVWKIFLAGAAIYKLGEYKEFQAYYPTNLESPHSFVDGLAFPLSKKFEALYEKGILLDFDTNFNFPIVSTDLEEIAYHWRFNRRSLDLSYNWERKHLKKLPKNKEVRSEKISKVLDESRNRFTLYRKGLKIENLTEEGYKE